MKFGLDKCAKATFLRGRLTSTIEIKLNEDTSIRELDQEETYKCLGIDERGGIQHAKMKEKIRRKCHRLVRAILHTELNARKRKARSNQHTSNTCSHLQFQCYRLELRRNKTNGQKNTKATDLE